MEKRAEFKACVRIILGIARGNRINEKKNARIRDYGAGLGW
jgi:hypothetical protein